jgi:hypothetical protein
LSESVKRHNKDNIPFYISVPREDIQLFKSTLGTDICVLVSDEELIHESLCQSWKNQQIVKMMFWKSGITENYVVLDSDSYFIKDFYYKDFLVGFNTPLDDAIPYTVMHEQKDLFQWTAKHKEILGFNPQQSFAECRQPIMDLFDRKGRLYDFGPVPVIWSSKVWNSLEEEYIKPNNLTFEKLINTISSEFSWYGEWLLVRKPIELWPIEPMFKVFHYRLEYEQLKAMGYTEEHWAQNYLGVVMQSSSGLPIKY